MGAWLKTGTEIAAVLRAVKTVMVVGLGDNPGRPAHGVARTMQGHGYKLFPVHPAGGAVLGEPIFPTVADVPQRVDLVDIFRHPAHLPGLLTELLKLPKDKQPGVLWFQDGAFDEATALRAVDAGYDVVMTDCVARRLHTMD